MGDSWSKRCRVLLSTHLFCVISLKDAPSTKYNWFCVNDNILIVNLRYQSNMTNIYKKMIIHNKTKFYYISGMCQKFGYVVSIWLFLYARGIWKSLNLLDIKNYGYNVVYEKSGIHEVLQKSHKVSWQPFLLYGGWVRPGGICTQGKYCFYHLLILSSETVDLNAVRLHGK